MLELGDLPVERGGVIGDARLAWQAHGTLNAARDNVIVYPCSYGADHEELAWLIGLDGVLDPTRWFIVVPDMFSSGVSSSAADTADYPAVVTMADNVRAQFRLLTERFGATRVAAAYGFSMGAGQAYHWAALYPDFVERAIIVCGSARTSLHNKVFLSGLLRTLEAAPEYLGDGRFSAEPVATLRAFAHILQEADISANDLCSGDLAKALNAITARVLLMPGQTDLYFRVADNEAELVHLRHGQLATIPSIWGHWAGSPEVMPADLAFLTSYVRSWLDS
ncbi:MAG: alpha/beta fold hydrolase [Streptosporangiaceae bacterium]